MHLLFPDQFNSEIRMFGNGGVQRKYEEAWAAQKFPGGDDASIRRHREALGQQLFVPALNLVVVFEDRDGDPEEDDDLSTHLYNMCRPR